jgi:hypothetical protein
VNALLAAGAFWGWTFGEVAIAIVVVAAVVALVWIALRQFGIAVPVWVQQVFWVLVVAVVVILAIRFVTSL